jgi:hypothetical protein
MIGTGSVEWSGLALGTSYSGVSATLTTSGNATLTYFYIPEPGTASLMLLGFGGLALPPGAHGDRFNDEVSCNELSPSEIEALKKQRPGFASGPPSLKLYSPTTFFCASGTPIRHRRAAPGPTRRSTH